MNKNDFLVELSESPRTDFGRVDFAKQPEPQKVFSSIWALESQVNNGGFLQYFVSSDFDTANFAPTALTRVGAYACAGIVERALHLLPTGSLSPSREACEQLVDSLEGPIQEQFETLDSEFFTYPDNSLIYSLRTLPLIQTSLAPSRNNRIAYAP